MERARTAREAVEIVGELIDKYGYATYGGNSHLFADRDEGWVLIEFAGGKGLWVAQRLGPDDVRVSRPGYIGEVPLDYRKHARLHGLAQPDLVRRRAGLVRPGRRQAFNVNSVYAEGKERYPRSAMEQELRDAAPIDLRRMMDAVRDPRIPGIRPATARWHKLHDAAARR